MTITKIKAQITITATYNDAINIKIYDKNAGLTFIDMIMTREQFINATMNRLEMTDIEYTKVRDLDHVGKQLTIETLIVEIPKYGDKESAMKIAQKECPEGFTPDLYFGSQESFFSRGVVKDAKHYARTQMRKWE